MGQTLGIDRDLARKIKRMSRKELDGYLTRVTDKSYNNGYEQGLVEGIALAGQAMDEILKEEVIKGTFPAEKVDEIKKAVGTYIARVPERAAVFAATRNPARSIGIYDEVGSLVPGKKADIVLADEKLNIVKVI